MKKRWLIFAFEFSKTFVVHNISSSYILYLLIVTLSPRQRRRCRRKREPRFLASRSYSIHTSWIFRIGIKVIGNIIRPNYGGEPEEPSWAGICPGRVGWGAGNPLLWRRGVPGHTRRWRILLRQEKQLLANRKSFKNSCHVDDCLQKASTIYNWPNYI
jgi:hypothetical protein